MRDLPLWFRLAILTVLLLCLVGLFVHDWTAGEQGSSAAQELALIGVIATALGLDQLRRGGDNK